VAAAALWPLGLEGPALWLMEQGARWILGVAHWVAAFPGAQRPVAAPPGWVLPVMALGALWLAIWPGWPRLAGLAPMAVAALAWGAAPRPALLIAQDGALVGLMGPEGRVLSRATGAGFAARNWLAADGDGADQAAAAARAGFRRVPGGAAAALPWAGEGARIVHLWGREALGAVPGHCTEGAVVVLAARWTGPPPGPCRLLDERALDASGAQAAGPGGWTTTAQVSGRRPWAR
jgi:competence protein ComEC